MMGWTYSTYEGGERRGIYRVLVRNLEGKRPLEDLGVVVRIILKMGLQEVGWGVGGVGTGLIWLENWDRLLALANAVRNRWVP
jgi:hypothetical protein